MLGLTKDNFINMQINIIIAIVESFNYRKIDRQHTEETVEPTPPSVEIFHLRITFSSVRYVSAITLVQFFQAMIYIYFIMSEGDRLIIVFP